MFVFMCAVAVWENAFRVFVGARTWGSPSHFRLPAARVVMVLPSLCKLWRKPSLCKLWRCWAGHLCKKLLPFEELSKSSLKAVHGGGGFVAPILPCLWFFQTGKRRRRKLLQISTGVRPVALWKSKEINRVFFVCACRNLPVGLKSVPRNVTNKIGSSQVSVQTNASLWEKQDDVWSCDEPVPSHVRLQLHPCCRVLAFLRP